MTRTGRPRVPPCRDGSWEILRWDEDDFVIGRWRGKWWELYVDGWHQKHMLMVADGFGCMRGEEAREPSAYFYETRSAARRAIKRLNAKGEPK